jgi:hypothetical protein
MGTMKSRNTTTFNRCLGDASKYPYCKVPANMYKKLNGYQLAIMTQIISNTDDWNLVKYEIQKRLGFPERKFLKAWKELESLGYIKIERRWGHYRYIINEDPDYTTGTGADCEDYTTCSSTGCTDASLTITNNNYYNNISTGTDASCYENQFNELKELYPTSVSGTNGITYMLKGKIKECEKLYIEYLKTGKMSHNEIIKCLKTELANKTRTGNNMYQVALLRWIEDEYWLAYKDQTNKPVYEPYGANFV